jgi:hypothetical protein
VIVVDREIKVISASQGTTGYVLSRQSPAGGIASPVPAVVVVGGAGGLNPGDIVR